MLGVSRLFSVPFNRPHPSNHLLLQPPSISLLNNGETLYDVPVSCRNIANARMAQGQDNYFCYFIA